MFNIITVLKSLSEKRPIFHAEADFQQSLAWEIREHYPDCKIRLETKVFGANRKVYLDILCVYKGRKYAIELKYKTLSFTCLIDGEEFALNNQGAQDIGRYDVLKDIQRLEEMVTNGVADEGILIFLTNDRSYYSIPYQEINTVDRNFRIHEGSHVGGKLLWAEETGHGTMKGREKPINLKGNYEMSWDLYSQINFDRRSEFHYLMLQVNKAQSQQDNVVEPKTEILPKKRVVFLEQKKQSTIQESPSWFLSFSQKGDIPTSLIDLRNKIGNHLQQKGYHIHLNRTIGNDKIDIWAEKGTEMMAIELRYKTALLQTIYEGNHVQLKNQGAHDISRYDYISDIGKMERVVQNRSDIKGYVILLTNDRLYWQQPKKINSVDEAFHIYDEHVVNGVCTWKEEASKGTTAGREEPVCLSNSYKMKWQPYLELGEKKNGLFQVLFVEVK